MKVTTWNVNGIRSLKKTISCVLTEFSSDVVCFQETKVSRGQIPETTALVDGYSSYFSYPRKQSGYSGVATYCKDKYVPEDAEECFEHQFLSSNGFVTSHNLPVLDQYITDITEFDYEGRVMITHHLIKHSEEIHRLAIINVYCPRVDPEKPDRHIYKIQFCMLLEAKLRELCKTGCSVIIVGDMNIVHTMIDHCDPCAEEEFYSSESRQWMRAFLSSKVYSCEDEITVVDAFRHFYPGKKECYTCWNVKTGARQTNYGTRIDYVLVTSDLLPVLASCDILSDYHGSDHCPVEVVLRCESLPPDKIRLPALCTRLWPEFTGQQRKLHAFFHKTQNLADRLTANNETKQTSNSVKKPTVKTKGQKSITNFFKCPVAAVSSLHSDIPSSWNEKEADSNFIPDSVDIDIDSANQNSADESVSSSPKNNGSSSTVWKSVLTGPPKPPLCSGHKKECVLRTVKKKGPNCGRNFFMCAQPAGHASNPDANCNFFKWVNPPKINKLKKTS